MTTAVCANETKLHPMQYKAQATPVYIPIDVSAIIIIASAMKLKGMP